MGILSKFRSTPQNQAVPLGPDVVATPENATVDVLFLHGLTGHREKTWTAEQETESWPKSLLSKDLPTARIITYGYDASVLHLTRAAGQNTVREHAMTLLNDLGALRTNTVGRPIIFVVHSLGGIVIQDALLVCNNPNDQAQSDILLSTRGIAFLGTPHAGADLERFATAVARIVSTVKKPNKKLLQVLNRNSEVLANITGGFHTMVLRRLRDSQSGVKPIELHAFIEEKPVKILEVRVVEPESAKIPGYNFDTIPADHMGMTKFRTATDPGYQRVLHRLKCWVGNDTLDGGSIGVNYREEITRLSGMILADSEPPISVKQLCESSDLEPSMKWFTKSQELRTWLESYPEKLWLQGTPGDGKTVLMAYFLRKLRHSPEPIIVSVFRSTEEPIIVSVFCSTGDSEGGIIASMIAQVLQQNPYSARAILKQLSVGLQQCKNSWDTNQFLWKLLQESVKEGPDVLFVIDGIDALGSSAKYAFLRRLHEAHENLKIARTYVRVLVSSNVDEDAEGPPLLAHYSCIDRGKERRDCLKSLLFEEWNARESRVENVKEGGTWLSSHPEYNDWSEMSRSALLWIEGKPGSGKSTITKLIIRRLEGPAESEDLVVPGGISIPRNDLGHAEPPSKLNLPRDDRTIIARFYYSFRGGITETSHKLMLQSIVYQIFARSPRLFPLLCDRYRTLRRKIGDTGNQEGLWTYEDMKSALYSLRRVDFDLKVVIVLDGLDESDSDGRGDVISFLLDLACQNSRSNACTINVLIASRPENDINYRLMETCTHRIQLQQVNQKDIELIVDSWVRRMESEYKHKRGEETFSMIKQYIITHSSGVFLWVALVLRDLEQCIIKGGYSKADLMKRLVGLPKDLGGKDGFYRAMINSLIKTCQEDEELEERGRRIFAWVTFATRPLSIMEIQDVWATPPQSDTTDLACYVLEDHIPLELDQGILSACGGLVEVRDSDKVRIVQLIHQTAREFLLDKSHVATPYDIDEIRGDREIAWTCYRYIRIIFTTSVLQMEADAAFSQSEQLANHLSGHGLLPYALGNFTTHLDHLGENDKAIRREFELFIAELSKSKGSYACLLLQSWIDTTKWPRKLRIGANESSANSCMQSVLSDAAREKKEDVAQILLALKSDLLHLEAEHGNTNTVKFLLGMGGGFDDQDTKGRTPMHLAAQNGHVETVKALLVFGANLNLRDELSRTPLFFAALHGHLEMTKYLVQCGADANTLDVYRQTPIFSAARNGHLETVRFLAQRGADVNAEGRDGQTPLHVAAQDGHTKTVRLLVDFGADINIQDVYGQTPLSLAARNGHLSAVSCLVACGVDLNTRDSNGQTPLQLANESGHAAISEMLIEMGADNV